MKEKFEGKEGSVLKELQQELWDLLIQAQFAVEVCDLRLKVED